MHDFFKSTLRDDDIKTVKLAWAIFTSFPMNVVFVGVVLAKIAYIVQSNDIALSFKLDNFGDFIVPNAVVFGRHRKKPNKPQPKTPQIHRQISPPSKHRPCDKKSHQTHRQTRPRHHRCLCPHIAKGLIHPQSKKQPNACRPHKQRKDNQNQPQQKHGSA